MQGMIAALRWMTILPMPAQRHHDGDMQEILPWLPVTGLAVGLLVLLAAYLGALFDPWLGAFLAVFVWLLVTGGLHADGLADLSDALGASHHNKERFLIVLKDPHIGSFGVLALIFLILAKLILLKLLIDHNLWWGVVLIPVWARLGVLYWCRLPALTHGFAALLNGVEVSQHTTRWLAGLILVSFFLHASLCLAIVFIYIWYLFLKHRLGGMNGDCLGAGIEYCEIMLLTALLII